VLEIEGAENQVTSQYNERNKNGVTYPPAMHKSNPMIHILMVSAGISGSSMLETEALTSGYRLSSSSMALRSNSILGEKEKGLVSECWDGDMGRPREDKEKWGGGRSYNIKMEKARQAVN
jgi:hypothetical protein